MFTKHRLKARFNRAAANFPAAMAQLFEAASRPEGAEFLNLIPVCNLDIWTQGPRNLFEFNNCTNFALNRNTRDRLHPGQLGPRNGRATIPDGIEDFGRFMNDTMDNALYDGLIPLGSDLPLALTTGAPVALFFSEGKKRFDYHWFALRRDGQTGELLWAHKLGHHPAEDCRKFHGNIFEAAVNAGDRSYDHFAGYYAAPQKILKSSFAPPQGEFSLAPEKPMPLYSAP